MIPVPSNRTGAHFDIRRMTFIPATVLQSVLLTLLISTQFSLTSLPNIWTTEWLFGLVYFKKHLGPTYKSVFLKTQFLPFWKRSCLQVSFTNRFHPPPPRSYPFLFLKSVYIFKKMYTDKPWISWGNSRHFATPPLASMRNDVRGTAEIPYYPDLGVLLIVWSKFPSWLDQSEALPRPG